MESTSSGEVQPLRIQKSNSNSSVTTSPAKRMSSPGRPLAELSPMGIRRNSPSQNLLGVKVHHSRTPSRIPKPKRTSAYHKPQAVPTQEDTSSPFEVQPTNSPLAFWRGRDRPSPTRTKPSENMVPPKESLIVKRTSLERLKNASRVSNSSMLARESSLLERNSTGGIHHSAMMGHRRSQSKTEIPSYSPTKRGSPAPPTMMRGSPSRSQPSPGKSSLSKASRYESQFKIFDAEEGTFSENDESEMIGADTPRPALRQPKSVSFDQAPPQINEYEMITPDPSSVASGSREGSYESDAYDMDNSFEGHSDDAGIEDSFDESLEDTGKTPVVLPEDWGFMSPKTANTQLADTFEDPFGTPSQKPLSRSESVMSNGERRPLPAIPGGMPRSPGFLSRSRSESAAASPRILPTPPRPASVSKAEILGMRESSPIPLDERLRMLAIQNEKTYLKEQQAIDLKEQQAIAEQEQKDKAELAAEEVVEDDDEEDFTPPQVSRDDVLRELRDRRGVQSENSSQETIEPVTAIDYANVDPDFPIPSRETSSDYEEDGEKVPDIVVEAEDTTTAKHNDLYAMSPRPGSMSRSPSRMEDYPEDSVIHHQIDYDDVSEESEFIEEPIEGAPEKTPEPQGAALGFGTQQNDQHRVSLPEFKGFGDHEDLGRGLRDYMSQSPPNEQPRPTKIAKEDEAKTSSDSNESSSFSSAKSTQEFSFTASDMDSSSRPCSSREEIKTPDSVIHNPVAPSDTESEHDTTLPNYEDYTTPEIPQPEATIRAPGSKLKTRASITPQELQDLQEEADAADDEQPPSEAPAEDVSRRRSLKLKLDLPALNEELGGNLAEEFEKLMEAKKRGYHMKENTDVIVARRNFSGEANKPTDPTPKSPVSTAVPQRKVSGKTWTTEPWNGKMRRQSMRRSLGAQKLLEDSAAAPPVPTPDEHLVQPEEGVERGRLFVKVVGLKDLDLPLPTHERNHFQLTLDNGLHCVTTAWLELGRNAPVNQEFELTVFDELDFSLTLQTKLERPVSQASSNGSIFDAPKKSKSALSRLLQSPKKRKEAARKLEEEEQAARSLEAQRAAQPPTSWDLLHLLVGADGSFARSVVSLDEHEDAAFGRVISVDVPCYNSWASEDIATTRSKHGGIQRLPPYKIGKLSLQLLYIPKPRGARDDDMPLSMGSAVRALRDAETSERRAWEGFLSQQGGDCPYWRRRFFRLRGSNLTSYHETTRQRRSNINLAKATKLIDDKRADGKKGGRRKSAFAEEEEGYMFVEEGFRIRFANGEVIDFYADSRAHKDEWMAVLADVVGKDVGVQRGWVSAVLAKRPVVPSDPVVSSSSVAGAAAGNSGAAGQVAKQTGGAEASQADAVAPRPRVQQKAERPQSTFYEKPPPPISKDAGTAAAAATSPSKKVHAAVASTPAATEVSPRKREGLTGRRKAVKSMIF